MAIYKAKIESNFATIPNSSLQDKSISFAATGLLSLMLSLPDDWDIHKSWLQEQKIKCGRDKLTSMMKELVDAGYVVRKVKQKEDGLLDGVDWLVYPTVQLKNRETVKPFDGKPVTTKETDIQNKQLKDLIVPAKPKRSKFKYSDYDMKAAEWIRERVLITNPASPKCNIKSWANTIRLMVECDGLNHREILQVFKWANCDHFWCNNIQCPEKLRKQFGNLKGRMSSEKTNNGINASGLSASQQAIARARKERDSTQSGSLMGFDEPNIHGQVHQEEWSGRIIDMDGGDS